MQTVMWNLHATAPYALLARNTSQNGSKTVARDASSCFLITNMVSGRTLSKENVAEPKSRTRFCVVAAGIKEEKLMTNSDFASDKGAGAAWKESAGSNAEEKCGNGAVRRQGFDLQQSQKISLIGHSAGGWLARVYLAEFGVDRVSLLLTLGTPHLPPPKGVPGVIDQTRGLLDYVEKFCPAACYGPQLKYVCIAGRYLKGERLFKSTIKGSTSKMESIAGANGNLMVVANQEDIEGIDNTMYEESTNESATPALRARFVGQGYKQVCGQADVWGDGVVPVVTAHLEGAMNITLEGVYHSPVGSDDISRPWYGSSTILDKWVHHLLD